MQFAKFLELILQKETVLQSLLLATVNIEIFRNLYVAGGLLSNLLCFFPDPCAVRSC